MSDNNEAGPLSPAVPLADSRARDELGPTEGGAAEGATVRQFVTFQMGEELFAVPLTDVQEIIRLPSIVEVPMSISSLEGLANLRGSVLPIINLRRVFNLDPTQHNDATRVVVVNKRGLVGFIVDRMSRVVTAEPREIETVGRSGSTIETELLEGVVKRGQSMIMILDTDHLTGQLQTPPSHRPRRENGGTFVDRGDGEGSSDEVQLVSFELDGQEYALPIECVQEIVQVPESISRIPLASSHSLGMMNLRDRLLPLVSLRSMFGMPAAPVGEQSRIVVVAHSEGGAEMTVGVVIDTAKEVLRVPRSIVDPVPAMLSAGGQANEVDQICRMEDGRRLVSILRADQLFLNSAVRAAIDDADLARGKDAVGEPETQSSHPIDEDEQFVVFRVADEEYGVPIESVQEIVRIPDQLTRVPTAPSFIEGVVNLRGSVLPVIDQRRRFALPDMERNDRQRIVVFLIHGMRTGFIVDSVSEVLKISKSRISDAPDMSLQHGSAITRVANIVEMKRMILMLEVEKLLDRSETASLKAAA
ncbi:chemotaxis protein CheW [Aureimonas glaciei]|uniref:Chemotaxis protein CheW n=1 Tax=Aureimonas glaciei TaxID=1776957 RepID=A0A916YDW6_9HYPH|nr:chemotaxis protein CheW [Aureimonas glaciei]GGD41628.1 chemotaxis protein CheW [Aureimonas glaciei]